MDSDSTDSSYDAIVIGAGIFGCGITHELARRGLRVAAVDMNPGPGLGSTSSSGAIVRFMYSTVEGVKLAWEGNRYWEGFAEHVAGPEGNRAVHEHGTAHKIPTGLLFLRDDDALLDAYAESLTIAGVPFEDLSNEQIRERFPSLGLGTYGGPCSVDDDRFWADATDEYRGGLYTPDAGYVSDPQLAAQNLHTAAVAWGATFRFGRRVTEVLVEDARAAGVLLDDGARLDAPVVVNVGGPWSSRLNDLAGLTGSMNIATRPMRHEAHLAPAPKGVDFESDGTIVADLDQGIYFRPATGNQIFVGSTDPECDGHDWVTDLEGMNREITGPIWERQMMRVAKRVDDFGVPHERRGLAEAYDVSTDWGPIYDRTDLDGFYVAIGTSGNQFKNACVASHLMAELVVAVEGGHDHDAEPLVVTGMHTGIDIDMAAFSRNRPVNEASTGGVLG